MVLDISNPSRASQDSKISGKSKLNGSNYKLTGHVFGVNYLDKVKRGDNKKFKVSLPVERISFGNLQGETNRNGSSNLRKSTLVKANDDIGVILKPYSPPSAMATSENSQQNFQNTIQLIELATGNPIGSAYHTEIHCSNLSAAYIGSTTPPSIGIVA